MVHALKRGILIADFHELSIGMILDYINQYDYLHGNKEKQELSKWARQSEFNNF